MNSTIEAPFQLRDTDREIITNKINDLEKFESRSTQINVYFKEDDGSTANDILAEIRVRVPGKDVFASATNPDAMKAFNNAYNDVKRNLKKRRDQMNDHQSEVKKIRDIVYDV